MPDSSNADLINIVRNDMVDEKAKLEKFLSTFDNTLVDQFVVLDESGVLTYTHKQMPHDQIAVYPVSIELAKTFTRQYIGEVLSEYQRVRDDNSLQSKHITQALKDQIALLENHIELFSKVI